MYEPLQFLQQIDSFIMLPKENKDLECLVNERSQKWVESKGKKNIIKNYFSAQKILSLKAFNSVKILNEKNKDLILDWCDNVKVIPPLGEDFFNMIMFTQIRNEWGKNKIVYKVDRHLIKTLSKMELPKEIAIDCVSKLPVNCLYVEFDGTNDSFCKDCCGCFVECDIVDGTNYILFVLLVKDRKSGRVMPIRMHFCLNLEDTDSSSKCNINLNTLSSDLNVVLENDESSIFNEKLFCKFIFNFIIYLHASNKDVEVSETTKSVYKERKSSNKPKNSFKEVRQYNVGFRYGKTIKAGNKKVKYKKSNLCESASSRQLSSHYRSAHWHTYWVGSGESKERVIKWVEGVFVNGNRDNNDVVIHKVK